MNASYIFVSPTRSFVSPGCEDASCDLNSIACFLCFLVRTECGSRRRRVLFTPKKNFRSILESIFEAQNEAPNGVPPNGF